MSPRLRRLVGMTAGSEMVELVAKIEDDRSLRWFAWSQLDLGRESGSCGEERLLVRLAENEDGGQICKDVVAVAAWVAWTRFRRGRQWQSVITEKYGAHDCNIGDDGGFAPNVSSFREATDLVKEAISRTGYNEKIKIALDVATTKFCIEMSLQIGS